MSALLDRDSLLEHRDELLDNTDELWASLTLAQKFSASSLTQFGFKLDCIRDSYDSHVAVLTCNDTVAIISRGGEINTSPHIQMRD